MSTFQPISRTRVADQVADAIRDAIVSGTYSPGQRLPAERELAVQFDVNRSSVREALHRLQAWGLVDVRHGGGVKVSDFLARAGLHLLPFLMAPGGLLDPDLMRDLLTVRVALLGFTAEQAAQHASPDHIDALTHALAELDEVSGIDAIQLADFAFFEALVAASGNRVLQLMSTAIGAAYQENRSQFAALYPSEKMITVAHHAALVGIETGDSTAAGEAMRLYAAAALVAWSASSDQSTPSNADHG